jgi:hypothetical protein
LANLNKEKELMITVNARSMKIKLMVVITLICALWAYPAFATTWFQGNVDIADLFDITDPANPAGIYEYTGGTYRFDLTPTAAMTSGGYGGSYYNLGFTGTFSFTPDPFDVAAGAPSMQTVALIGTFYTASKWPNNVSFGTYDPTATPFDPLADTTVPHLDINLPSFLNVADMSLFFTADLGDLTDLGGGEGVRDYQLDLSALDATTNMQPVPEPSTIFLIGIGLAGMGIWRRRKA